MAAPSNLIPDAALQEARLDKQLRATLALVGGDPDRNERQDRAADLMAAAALSGRTEAMTIAAESDADLMDRAEQWRAIGCEVIGPTRHCAGAETWQSFQIYAPSGDGEVSVTLRGPVGKS